MYYVYILKGKKHYVGYTNNIERRIGEHKRGESSFTNKIGEKELLGYYEFEKKEDAMRKEKEIKKSGHIERYIGKEGYKGL